LQPQGFYVADVFSWSSLLLTGFVLVSTFLGKFGDLIISFIPLQFESFEEYLRRTDGCTGKVINSPQSRTLIKLKEIVEEEKAAREGKLHFRGSLTPLSKSFQDQRLAALIEQKVTLIQILDSTQVELESLLSKTVNTQLLVESTQMSDMKNSEDMLEQLWNRNKKLSSELETYQMEQGVGSFKHKDEFLSRQ
jgi:hypothetical protein